MAKRTGKSQNEITSENGDIQPKAPRTRPRRSTAKASAENAESGDITADVVPAVTSGTVGAVDYLAHGVAHDTAIGLVEAASTAEPTEDEIRFRAYQHYLERGGLHGADFDDWLRAERELRRR